MHRVLPVLTPELMASLYGVQVDFLDTASGPVLVPRVEGETHV